MKKIKCELCDGKGWLTITRIALSETGFYVPKPFKEACSWCDGKGEIPPMEEEDDDSTAA